MTTISLKPRDAFKVTGVSPELQRSWRSAGLLPRLEDGTRAEFGLADLVRLAAIKSAARFHFALPPITRPLENFLSWAVVDGELDEEKAEYLLLTYSLVMPTEPQSALVQRFDFAAWMEANLPMICCVVFVSRLAVEVRDAAVAMLRADAA